MRVELYEFRGRGRAHSRRRGLTNADGRTDAPLISASHARVGRFELVFHVGDYFRRQGVETADPPFLDLSRSASPSPTRSAHYHVPLLLSPWSYSTYRGS